MRIRHPATLQYVQVLESAPWKRYFIGAVIVMLYGISIQWGAKTCGEPYEWALEEQKRTIKEKAKFLQETGVAFDSGKQDRSETDLKIDEEALPSKLLPNAWACAFIFVTIALHLLFHLMCHWSISFKAAALYQRVNSFRHGAFVRVTPNQNKGSAAICEVVESEVTLRFHFKFQYQSYEVVREDEEDADLVFGDEGMEGVRLIGCPTNLTWAEYRNCQGLKTDTEIERCQDRYGSNIFELPKPTFLDLFKKQLMAPLAIFQFFCTALWMLDTYWKYTCFTLLSVLGFEASTALQRLKSMAQLRGMGTKSYNVNVFRMSSWAERPIEELLPGDIVSLVAKLPDEGGDADKKDKPEDNKPLIVPCDCLVLRGSAIVNEATLTGESVPQMKDELANVSDETATVDAFSKHRVHTLFSGTSLIQVTPPPKALAKDSKAPDAMCPPDGGIVCFVLRTGFNSSQGELMRMIEFSTQEVAADKIETAMQLLFLLCFALVAAGYVLKKGLEDPTRPTYKTLLRCTLIITSVVPPSLPMQMAFAVHTALMSLMKVHIFCTEPFRVPYAGRVAYCFFDKTGTLTSDQMVAIGVVNAEGKGAKDGQPQPTKQASKQAAMVVAGCHSLIELDGKALGDPIEVAALSGVAWSYVPGTATASPTAWKSKERFMAQQKEILANLKDDEAEKQEKEEINKKLQDFEKQLKVDRLEAKRLQVTIEGRFHFSSELQRMSTICKVVSQLSDVPSGAYCLTKGSPEAVQRLCTSTPSWYDATYRSMAEKGQRVLALAYKRLDSDASSARSYGQQPRDASEKGMTFAGFISFRCENRKDSMLVIKSLQESKHSCVMLTGDAPLTALSVAHEVGIAEFPAEKSLILQESKEGSGKLEWVPAMTSQQASPSTAVPFEAAGMQLLREKHDLVITGHALELALQAADGSMREHLHTVQIYARLSPWQKEQITSSVRKTQKVHALMCGDGGNDVGALKEADVGLALLSGFGNANVGGSSEELAKKEEVQDAETALQEQRQQNSERAQAASKKAQEEFGRKRKDLMGKQQQWIEEELQARRARGQEVGVMDQFSAMKVAVSKMQAELKKEQELVQKKHGSAFADGAAKWAGDMEGLDDTPMVQPGDASTAAPFTTKTPSIGACVDIIRQGRCTLLSAVQQMEIMMLESMIAAYTMSTMSVDGTRPSEAQMMASGTLITVASLAFSFARPVDRMHPVRPLSSVFHPAIFFSMLGQLAIHLGCMVFIAERAKEIMGPAALKEIIDFEKERTEKIDAMDEDAFNEWNWFTSVPFKNNLLNTCCWLVETSQQIAVIFVNYKGRPWMKGMLENQPLFFSLFACVILVGVCAWGALPWLNSMLNLEDVPEDLRVQVMGCLAVSLIGSFAWDRLMVAIFAPEIWQVMVEEAKATKLADVMPILQTVGYGVVGLLVLGQGNPLLWGLAYYMYRRYKNAAEATASPQAQVKSGKHE